MVSSLPAPWPVEVIRTVPASDLISRGLAQKVGSRCFQISDLITNGNLDLAKMGLEDLVTYVWRFAESIEQDRARAKREESSS